jgi:hypothetical protein
MAEFYSNLPRKEKDNLDKTIDTLMNASYAEPFEFSANDYDATVGFFIKKGFDRKPAEETAYIILQQAKIDSVPVMEILDTLGKAEPAQLSELITIILNSNRFKTSRLGVRKDKDSKDIISRNILA